jgi:hypothetical protein
LITRRRAENVRKITQSVVGVALFAIAAIVARPASSAAHEVVLDVGRSAAGQIKIRADLSHPLPLGPSIFPGIPGFASGEPAFHSIFVDDPANDLFQPALSSNFQFVITAADPGIGIYTPSGPVPLNTPVSLGPPVFDFHPVWHIPGGPVGATYNITLKVQDTTGTYTDSAPLVVPFTAVPEPHALAILALAPLALRRRRRR